MGIDHKFGICIDCPEDSKPKMLIAGRCQMHYWISRKKIYQEKKKFKMEDEKNELDLFFQKIISVVLIKNPFCWECKSFIPEKFYRHAIAHIFQKSIFKSVETHPFNFLILGAGCGCHDKSHRIDTFSQMKVFPMAVQRFRFFEKNITEKHKYLENFRIAAEQILQNRAQSNGNTPNLIDNLKIMI